MPNVRIVDDWRWVLRRAWSIRWIIAAVAFSGLEVALGVITAMTAEPPFGMPPGIFAALSGACSMAAFASRFIAQRKHGAE